jgi:inosine-uridine nucleoside N-ribohydrolase
LRRPLSVARETHGETGLGYAAVPPAGVILDWAHPFERLIAEQTEPVTLVTLGPLTSLALTLRRDRDMVRRRVARHVAMAGALTAAGNTTPFAEFNAWCDPEAVEIVLRAELGTEWVGLDVTRQVVLQGQEVARLAQADDETGRWLHDALRFYLEFHRSYEGLDGCVINDVVPIAALIQPEVLAFASHTLVVGLEAGDHRGHTWSDPNGVAASVAASVQGDAVRALLFERVLSGAGAAATAAS